MVIKTPISNSHKSIKLELDSTEKTSKKNAWDKSEQVEQSSYYWRKDPVITLSQKKKTNKPLIAELFCGCGGTSMGFEMAGFSIALGADILIPAITTFKHNHPNAATILGDIKKVTPAQLQEIVGDQQLDVLIGGIPCQGFSLNNRKRFEADERNFMSDFAKTLFFLDIISPICDYL